MSKFVERLGVIPFLLLGLTLFVLGLLALNHIVDNWWPFDVQRLDLVRDTALDRAEAALLLEAANTEIILAFLAAVVVAATGLALPLAFFLNQRFGRPGEPHTVSPAFLVVLRQSMWVGAWVAFCVWLQMNRTLGLAVAGLVAAVLALFEILLQVRTRAAHAGNQGGVG
jgi:hypothetical protein